MTAVLVAWTLEERQRVNAPASWIPLGEHRGRACAGRHCVAWYGWFDGTASAVSFLGG